jgi:hypothetical protein
VVRDEVIPGQLTMPITEAPRGDDVAAWGYSGNVVPLVRRGVLDPAT